MSWEFPGAPFEVWTTGGSPLPSELPPGELPLILRFKPTAVGSFTGTLRVRESDANHASATLRAEGLPEPSCPTPTQCHRMVFNPSTGSCVEELLIDGTACDPQSRCIEAGAVCQNGLCVGKPKVCDDGNACTTDFCNALEGCQSVPAPPCPGDGKCQVGVCNPQTGCGLAPAEDGTRCGPRFSCDAADVCISGSCQLGDPPDGFKCQAQSPCGESGRCNGSVCEKTAATPLTATWTLDAKKQVGLPTWGDFLLEPDGRVSTFGFFTTPRLRANESSPVPGFSSARRCMLWNKRLVCADFASNGRVSAVDLTTGRPLWDFNILAARPDFVGLTRGRNLFMARLAEMGSDRLGALFEGYPAGSEDPTQCRLYVLVVLNAAGTLITAQRVEDPLLNTCNHPHPYGFAADTGGGLYIAFSGTRNDAAPLVPDSPTLLLAYTRDGIFRWKATASFPGGELAVARGVLYPENSGQAFSTQTGTAVASLGVLGRVVATEDVVMTAPSSELAAQGTLLRGFDTRAFVSKWSVPTGTSTLGSDQLRLARWRPNPTGPAEDVALFFTKESGVLNLSAVRAQDGSEAFRCPISAPLRTEPQLFEVANGSMALMESADTCGKCDPPFANSAATFHTFKLPGIEVPDVPWSGTFGGASHDHHEDGVWIPTQPGN